MNLQIGLEGRSDPRDSRSPFQLLCNEDRKRRLELLKCLHQEKDWEKQLGIVYEKRTLKEDMALLQEATLIQRIDDSFFPGFFIVLKDELQYIKTLAQKLAAGLIVPLQDWYSEIRSYAREFSFQEIFPWPDINFFLLGSFILDLGQMIISNQGEPFFQRPPDRKSGHFYLWGIETDNSFHLGRYGHHFNVFGPFCIGNFGPKLPKNGSATLPDLLYPLIHTLGRDKALEMFLESIEAYENLFYYHRTPSAELLTFMEYLNLIDGNKKALVPIGNSHDCRIIEHMIHAIGSRVGQYFDCYQHTLEITFQSFRASDYARFSEFYSWFYHLLMDVVMEELIIRGLIHCPKTGSSPYILPVSRSLFQKFSN